MKYELNARNCEIGEHLKKVTEQKLGKLDKYFSDDQTEVKACFKKQAKLTTVEVMLNYSNKFVRASASGKNFYDCLDVVLPKLEGQIRKYRTRFDKHNKNVAFNEIGVYKGSKKIEDEKSDIVKQKKFKLNPLTVNEAIEEMELSGHSFYVFLEAKSNTVQVLYKRNDGDLGLIEPEV